jgi:hypothetical protein
VTPIETTSGRLHQAMASLLVVCAAQVLKWQEPFSAAGEMISRIALSFRRNLHLSQADSSSGSR